MTAKRTVDATELMSATQAANLLGKSAQTVYSYHYRGKLAAYRIPGKRALYFVRSDVEKFKK